MSLSYKIHPDRFSEMSGRMAAVIGYILGEDWAEEDVPLGVEFR